MKIVKGGYFYRRLLVKEDLNINILYLKTNFKK